MLVAVEAVWTLKALEFLPNRCLVSTELFHLHTFARITSFHDSILPTQAVPSLALGLLSTSNPFPDGIAWMFFQCNVSSAVRLAVWALQAVI